MGKAFRQFAATTVVLLGALGNASAAPVVISLGGNSNTVPENLNVQGFVFSPSCHYDLVPHYLGFDRSGCNDPQYVNPNYLGGNPHDASQAFLYVARVGGGTFSLQSLVLGFPAGTPVGFGFDLVSSEGGSELFTDSSPVNQQFQGPAWTNVSWLLFSTTGGAAVGFTDFTVDVNDQAAVPEPATFGLVALALAAAGFNRRSSSGQRARRPEPR